MHRMLQLTNNDGRHVFVRVDQIAVVDAQNHDIVILTTNAGKVYAVTDAASSILDAMNVDIVTPKG